MTPAEGIRKLGFRRWYERQLIECHGFLVTGFLSMVALVACLEELEPHASMRSLNLVLLIAACAVLCMWSLRRYHAILMRAERLGEHSVCARCGAYGVLDVLQSGGGQQAAHADRVDWLRVRCRKCAHQWMME
jgi:hypothetical protein